MSGREAPLTTLFSNPVQLRSYCNLLTLSCTSPTWRITRYVCSCAGCIHVCIVLYVCIVGERSERDTYRGNTIENRGYLFIYMYGRTYVILYFDPPYFCVRSAFDPVPNFTKQNPPV